MQESLPVVDLPLVSIVIPVFNGLPYFIKTLESARRQTYPNIEIVVVDGGSDDLTVEYLKSVETSISRMEYLPRGTPVARTWTRSCELAQGDFVKLLCQDDLIYPTGIRSQVNFLVMHQEADLVFSKRDIIDAAGSVVAKSRGGIAGTSRVLDGRHALRLGYVAGANIYGEPESVLFRRRALMELLPWNSSIPYLIDMEMYSRIMMLGHVGYLDETVGAFRISAQSWSTRLTREQTKQFRRWQKWVSDYLGDVTTAERLRAGINASLVSWMRTAAYVWLRARGHFESEASLAESSS